MRLVAITDRAVIAPGLAGAELVAAYGAAAARVVRPGVVIQLREKDLDGGVLLELARALIAAGAEVIVNDRVDVAIAAGAAGVHLPERGIGAAAARRLAAGRGPGFVVGVSCHSVDGAVAAARDGAGVVQLGPIWDTPGKGPALGVAALAEARARLPGGVQLVAVGGVDGAARAREAIAAGASAVAAIRAVWAGRLQ